jgi:uncharacterized protein YggE
MIRRSPRIASLGCILALTVAHGAHAQAIGFGESAVRTRDFDVTPEMRRVNGNADSAQQAALGRAVANAQRKAAAIASALGGSLGQVIMTTTRGDDDGRVVLGYGQGGQGEAFGTGPSIKPAEITVEAVVTARWRYLFR